VDSLVEKIARSTSGVGGCGEALGGEEEKDLAFTVVQVRQEDRGETLGTGANFPEKVAGEQLRVDSFKRRAGQNPTLFGSAEEIGARGVGQQEDDDVDEGGEKQGKEVAGSRGEEALERKEKVFLAAGGLVDVLGQAGEFRTGELAAMEVLFHVRPRQRIEGLVVEPELDDGGVIGAHFGP
jgi:hypothetical protein